MRTWKARRQSDGRAWMIEDEEGCPLAFEADRSDARLMAAAPDLVKALLALADFTEANFRRVMSFTPKDEVDRDVAQHQLLAPARAAIKKALGRE